MITAALAVMLAFQVDVTIDIDLRPDPTNPPPARQHPVPDSVDLATAFVDPGARVLVERARERRASVDRSVQAYRALAREHISLFLSAFGRERLFFRREVAARLHWRQIGASEVHVLGAREVVPMFLDKEYVPKALESFIPHLLFDPADDRLLIGLDTASYIRHPLAPGSEADYRFASGDTTRLALPDGRTITLYELRLLPRRAEPRLVAGSLWIEADDHAIVQAAFRIARPFDVERDDPDGDAEEELGDMPAIFKPIRLDIRYITVEYGLWEMRWWLPRLIAFEGNASMGRILHAPLRVEMTFSDYEVDGDSVPLPPVRIDLADGHGAESVRCQMGLCRDFGVVVPEPRPFRCEGRNCWCEQGTCRRVRVALPHDTASLLTSELLPHSVFTEGPVFAGKEHIDEIVALLDRVPVPRATLERPRLYWGLARPDLVRYNRVQGLALGTRAELEHGNLLGDVTVRFGTGDRAFDGELGVTREHAGRRHRIAVYHALASIDPNARPFALGNSIDALVFGRDEGDYQRATGIALSGAPLAPGASGIAWRLYAERQRPVEQNTDFSLRRLVDEDTRFRPVLETQPADQLGAAVELRHARGLNPTGFRWHAGLSIRGETGTYRFLTPEAHAGASYPLAGGLLGAIQAAAGTTLGTSPIQSHWFLGGAPTLRGYAPLTLTGTAFWRAHAEISTALPAARLAIFSDAGWAGPRNRFRDGEPLLSAGIGASLLDGLLRIDIARALRAPTGTRLHATVNAAL